MWIHRVRNLPLKSLSKFHFCLKRQLSVDITGNIVNINSSASITDLDYSIMMMVTAEDDACETLRKTINTHTECGIGYALLGFQHLRNRNITHTQEEFIHCLQRLEYLYSTEKLTIREKYFSAALVSWYKGNYLYSANLLESSLLHTSNDIIALRLAQDAYLASGDSRNALGCIVRCLHLFNDTHFLHNHMQSMLAIGYMEIGRFIDAEEISSRVVSKTNGHDIFALHALCSTYLLQGRSSEVMSVVHDHEWKHENKTGLQSLLYHKGVSMVQRGNYTGAGQCLKQLLEQLGPGSHRITSSLSLASSLLWLIYLNSEKSEKVENQVIELANLWGPNLNLHTDTVPMDDICAVMTLQHAISIPNRETIQLDTLSSSPSIQKEAGVKSQSWGQWRLPEFNTNPPSTLIPHTQPFISFDNLLTDHLKRIHPSSPSTLLDLNTLCPSLLTVKPIFKLSPLPSPSLVSEKQQATVAVTKPLIEVFRDMWNDRISDSADNLLKVRFRLSATGAWGMQRDVIEQTLVDLLVRNDQLKEAMMLLAERTALAPNDAQSWRRMAYVLSKQGHADAAEAANYTAWQLGIGQGGFGGSV